MMTSFKKTIAAAFNLEVLQLKRHVSVDYLRGIVIILVVYHHAFLGMEKHGIEVPDFVVNANMAAYSFRMPLFFIFSGIFAGFALRTKSVRSIIWSRYNLLLYPYLVWSALQIGLQILFSRYSQSEGSVDHFLYILYQPKQIAHFWYLPALFNSTLVFVLVKSKLKLRPGQHLLLGFTLFLCAPFVNEISMISNWMRFYVFLVIGDLVGKWLMDKEVQNRLKKLIYFLAILPLFVAAQYYYYYILGARSIENTSASFSTVDPFPYIMHESIFLTVSLIGCATLILLSILMEHWNRFKWLRIAGYHSLYIYIMHVMVVALNRVILTKVFGIDNYLVILVSGITLGIVVPIVFYNLIGKKHLWFLFSSTRKQQSESAYPASVLRPNEVRLKTLQSPIKNI